MFKHFECDVRTLFRVWCWGVSVTFEINENKHYTILQTEVSKMFGLMIWIMIICSRRMDLVVFVDEYSNVGSRESFRFRKAVKKSIYNYVRWWRLHDSYFLNLEPFIIETSLPERARTLNGTRFNGFSDIFFWLSIRKFEEKRQIFRAVYHFLSGINECR